MSFGQTVLVGRNENRSLFHLTNESVRIALESSSGDSESLVTRRSVCRRSQSLGPPLVVAFKQDGSKTTTSSAVAEMRLQKPKRESPLRP